MNDHNTPKSPDPTSGTKPQVRLCKRMAELNLCSRREADHYIEQQLVRVNGNMATLGQKVAPNDKIELLARAKKQQQERVTILLHKPVGFLSAMPDKDYRTSLKLITKENHWTGDTSEKTFKPQHLQGLAPAGRLDIDSTGLLVLTSNGTIAKCIIGEQSTVEKEYLVRVQGQIQPNGLALLNHGLRLDGVPLKRAKVTWQNQDQLRFVLQQGKKRQIRRMCEMVGLRVVALKRVRIGRVNLGALPLGKWRYLSDQEVF